MPGQVPDDLDTSKIKDWRAIVTLIVFVITNVFVLFPVNVPIWTPRRLDNLMLGLLCRLRIIPPRQKPMVWRFEGSKEKSPLFARHEFPVNFVTAPLIADLFLLAILAIGRKEVKDGTLGAKNIFPIDIMAFFITLAYIAISIDASGLIRYLAFKVLQKGGKNGHLLFCYLYTFFFGLTCFIGNVRRCCLCSGLC